MEKEKTEKNKKIEDVMKETNKKYGADCLVFGSEMEKVETFDTGCFSLNEAFGCGGIPRGRLIEISGAPSTGKTALAMFITANIQKLGGNVLWVDAERVFSPDYTKQMGIDINKLQVLTPDSGEQALDVVETHVATGEYNLVVIDSVAALVPQKEIDSEPTDVTIALIAKMMSRHLRVITGPASKTRTAIIYINQIRDNLMTYGYGKKTVTTGGKALPFYASVRLEVKAIGKIKDKDDKIVGNRLSIEAIKNKCGLPFEKREMDLYFKSGIDVTGDIFDIATKKGVIKKTGTTFFYNEEKLGVGRDTAKKYLEDNPKILKEIKDKVK